jgi:L-arabinonolactonase
MEIIPISDERCHLGEGPLWDQAEQALYWVDSLAPRLFRHDHESESTRSWDLPGRTVGSLAVRRSGGLILAMEQGFHGFDPSTGRLDLIAAPIVRDDIRFNDGKVDRAGRFLAGGMNRDYLHASEPAGSMFRLDTDLSVVPVLDGFVCFNGPCFSPDGGTIYVTGRDMTAIEAFDYDMATGTASGGRVLIDGINPDGATVDAEGFVWSAQWDDQSLLRISPQGEIVARLDVPGQVVTSLMFGGPDLDIVYVTTATRGEEGGGSPDAGRTLALLGTGYKGLAEPRFGG